MPLSLTADYLWHLSLTPNTKMNGNAVFKNRVPWCCDMYKWAFKDCTFSFHFVSISCHSQVEVFLYYIYHIFSKIISGLWAVVCTSPLQGSAFTSSSFSSQPSVCKSRLRTGPGIPSLKKKNQNHHWDYHESLVLTSKLIRRLIVM